MYSTSPRRTGARKTGIRAIADHITQTVERIPARAPRRDVMTNGVLVFEGMRVGVLPGDLVVEVDESGAISSKVILSTAYNVLPIWLRIANDELLRARQAAEAVASGWSTRDEINRELLVAEL